MPHSPAPHSPGHSQPTVTIRPVEPADYAQWRPLWDAYNAFYGREGETALPEAVTLTSWQRFLDTSEPMHALVAVEGSLIVGLAQYLYHRSTTRLQDACYLQDLFTPPSHRGRGIGGQLIEAVYAAARAAGSGRVYWQTHVSNAAGRSLCDKVARHAGFIVYSREL